MEVVTLTPRLAVAFAGATVVGFPLASLYGSGQAYSINLSFVGVEVLIVLSFLAVGAITAQRWTQLRRNRRVRGVSSATT